MTSPTGNIALGTDNLTTTTANGAVTVTGMSILPVAPVVPPEAVEPPVAATKPVKRTLEDSLAGLDDETRNYVLGEVRTARTEARALRERAKDAQTDAVKAFAKAMGVEDAPTDPAVLTTQLETERAAAQQSRVELAVYRLAGEAGGNPIALLDSRSFETAIKAIDPADSAAITAAIAEAVKANPTLGTTPVRRAPGPNPAAGSSANGAPDLEAQIADAQKRGDMREVIHLQNQKLAAPVR